MLTLICKEGEYIEHSMKRQLWTHWKFNKKANVQHEENAPKMENFNYKGLGPNTGTDEW